jgi:hypothetical protein
MNSSGLMKTLNDLYATKSDNKEIREQIAKILKNITSNDSNNDNMIHNHPDLIKSLKNNLTQNKLDLTNTRDRAILGDEIDSIINLLSNNSKVLNDKGLVTGSDIDKICSNFQSDNEFGSKLNKIRSLLSEINKEKQAIEALAKDVIFNFYFFRGI